MSDEATIQLFEEALASREWALGPYHPDTLSARHHLAHAYRAAGLFETALQLFQENLAAWELVMGPEHPLTLNSAAAWLTATTPPDATMRLFGYLRRP